MWKAILLNTTVMLGLARHILTTVGGSLVAKGVLEASDAETAVGALMALIGIAFSVMKNKNIST